MTFVLPKKSLGVFLGQSVCLSIYLSSEKKKKERLERRGGGGGGGETTCYLIIASVRL